MSWAQQNAGLQEQGGQEHWAEWSIIRDAEQPLTDREAAFERLTRRVLPQLMTVASAHARRITNDRRYMHRDLQLDPEHAAIEALWLLFEKAKTIRDPERWLYATLKILLNRDAKKPKLKVQHIDDEPPINLDRLGVLEILQEEVPDESLSRSVTEAVMGLPAGLREVISLYYLEGHSGSEVAGILGITPGALRVRLHRARKTLAEILGARPWSEIS